MNAINTKNIDTLKFFLNQNLDVHYAEANRLSILEFACKYGNAQILNLIFDRYQDLEINKVNESGNTLLCYAVHGKNIETIQFLLNRKADIHAAEKNTLSVVEFACKYGNAQILNLIFDKAKDIEINKADESGNTLLCYAIEGNNIETAKFLLL
jgi:ankyrin repeat protein